MNRGMEERCRNLLKDCFIASNRRSYEQFSEAYGKLIRVLNVQLEALDTSEPEELDDSLAEGDEA